VERSETPGSTLETINAREAADSGLMIVTFYRPLRGLFQFFA